MSELVEKLARNARFYENEALALAEVPTRRDNRGLGAEEAGTIAGLLREAVAEIAALTAALAAAVAVHGTQAPQP